MDTINPSKAVIIGVDTDHKEGDHMLWDERALVAPPPEFVKSVREEGVIEPVVLTRDGEVIDGRKRILAARKAKKTKVPYITVNGKNTQGDLARLMVLLNEIRVDDPLSVKAAKAYRMVTKHGMKAAAVASAFGVGTKQLGNYVKFAEMPAAVKKAVEQGKISLTAATNLHGAKDIPDKLAKLLSGGKATARKAKAVKRDKPTGIHAPPGKRGVNRLANLTGKGADHTKADKEIISLFKATKTNEDFIWGALWAVGEYEPGRDENGCQEEWKALLRKLVK